MTAQLLEGFSAIDGVTVYGPRDPQKQLGVVSVSFAGVDPREAAVMLDSGASGPDASRDSMRPLHAPGTRHHALGGTVRFSTSVFTTPSRDVEMAIQAAASIAKTAVQA